MEGYVEEALEDCPLAATKITEYQQVNKVLCAFRSELDELKHQKPEVQPVEQVPHDLATNLRTLEEEMTRMWQELRPALVKNSKSKKVHSTAGCSFRGSPLDWSTKCGWKWVSGDRNSVSCTISEAKKFVCCD